MRISQFIDPYETFLSPQLVSYGSPSSPRRSRLGSPSHYASGPGGGGLSGSGISGGGSSGLGLGAGGVAGTSFLDKLNTLARARKKRQEAEELAAEARQAMEDPLHPVLPDVGPGGYQLAEGEERSMIEPYSKVSLHSLVTHFNFSPFLLYVLTITS
ncbi:unnamed protein product [Protopolystoma xenopodis]|uniref:Uncharacterized protein n=1 Tax=Protopolystoma xenopodis TaxID=117903 RepID=A0A3S5B2Q4_9PLAT|nr:unnamed protein product [Protopolystoma xenopodis]